MRCREVSRIRSAPGRKPRRRRCAGQSPGHLPPLRGLVRAGRPARSGLGGHPSAGAARRRFDAAWAAARQALDEPSIVPLRGRRPSRVALIALAGLAQAAALLVAVWMPWRDHGPRPEPNPGNDPAQVAAKTNQEPIAEIIEEMPRLDIAAGQISIIHMDGRKVQSVELAHYEPSGGVTVAIDLEFLNTFEAMATP